MVQSSVVPSSRSNKESHWKSSFRIDFMIKLHSNQLITNIEARRSIAKKLSKSCAALHAWQCAACFWTRRFQYKVVEFKWNFILWPEKSNQKFCQKFLCSSFFNRKNEEHFYWFFHVLNCKAKKTRSSLTNVYSVKVYVYVVVIALYCRNSADLLGIAVKVARKNHFQVSNKCFVSRICIPHQFVISQEAFVSCHDQTCQKIAEILFPIDEVANFLNKFCFDLWIFRRQSEDCVSEE